MTTLQEAPVRATRTGRRWIVALVLLTGVIAAFFDRLSIAVLFTNSDFQAAMGTGFDPARLGLLMTAFLVPYALSGFLLGLLGDVYSPRRILAGAVAAWGALMLLMGNAGSYGLMMVYRVLLGITEGPQFAWNLKIISRWFTPSEHARANSLWLIGSPLGSAIGFPLTIWCVAAFGWRGSFFVIAAINLLVVLPLVLMFIRDWPPGAAETSADPAVTRPAFWESCRVFVRNWRYWLMVTFNCGMLIYLWGLNSWLPTYLEKARGFNLHKLGIFSALPFILMFLGQLLSGLIADRLGRHAPLCFVGLMGAGVLTFVGSTASHPHAAAIAIAFSAGCWGLALPALFSLILKIVPGPVVASATGVMGGFANLCGALAPFAVGMLIGASGDFASGLMLLVLSSAICSLAMLPLVFRY